MSKRIRTLGSACSMIGGLIGVLGWLLRFARLMLVPKAVLAAKLLYGREQDCVQDRALGHGRQGKARSEG